MGIFRYNMGMNIKIKKENIKISHEILKLIGEIDAFNGSWPSIKHKIEHKLGSLKHVSTIASIGSSTRIEGVQMSNTEIDAFLENLEPNSFLSRDQQEVLGYRDLLDEIFSSFDIIEINQNFIKQLHKILLSPSVKDEFHLGEYKKIDNHVVAQKNGKDVGIIFKTSSPFETPTAMEHIIEWFTNEKDIHPLLKCAVFIVHFLAIHPFQDGNGRLSRALTTLILLKEGYSYAPYCSLESIIEQNKTNYYKSLRETQKTFTSNSPNYASWTHFFLESLKKQQDLLFEKQKDIQEPRLSKSQENIMAFAQTKRSFQNSDIATALHMNPNTVKANLKKLVQLRLLTQNGIGKGTWYST